MEIKLTLALPRDEVSVPVVRRVLRASMTVLGVRPDIIADIELALTEAVTNVLDHAAASDEYEVSAGIDGSACVIEVVDRGHGFDGSGHGHESADPGAEEGRGIQLMRALVDKVEFSSRPHVGTVVHLEKQLELHEDSVMHELSEPVDHGPWSDEAREESSRTPPVG
jgi:serine/threonine-protein kinase RsbW